MSYSEDDLKLYIELTSDKDLSVQREAYQQLAEYLYPILGESIYIMLLDDMTRVMRNGLSFPDADIRAGCLDILYGMEYDHPGQLTYQEILKYLDDSDEHNRIVALQWLEYFQLDYNLYRVLDIIKNPAESRRMRLSALKLIGNQCRFSEELSEDVLDLLKQAFFVIRPLMNDDSPQIEHSAVGTLAVLLQAPLPIYKSKLSIPPKERQGVIDSILKLLDDPNRFVAQRAISAISLLNEEVLLVHILPFLKHENYHLRMDACRAISLCKYKDAVPILLDLLQFDHAPSRKLFLKTLSHILSIEDARPYLEKALEDDEAETVRRFALENLTSYKVDKEEARPYLEKALEDEAEKIRKFAKWRIERDAKK